MILRIDHVSIAVRDYHKAVDFFTTLFGAIQGVGATDRTMKYHWQLFSLGDMSRLEIMTPAGEGSFLDNFLARKEGGVHHITLQTPDIRKAAQELDARSIPYFDYHDYGTVWKELFIHPRDAFGVLIQIAEFNPDDWLPDRVKLNSRNKYELRREGNGYSLVFAHPGGGTASLFLDKDELDGLIRDLEELQGGDDSVK